MNNEQLLSSYLKRSLAAVKQQLGEVCTYLSFSKEKSVNKETGILEEYDAFIAHIKNEFGGKDKIVYRIDKPLFLLEVNDFKTLLYNLNEKIYERGESDTETV
jgi:hypothetical protein